MAKPGQQAKEEMARLAAMSRQAADLGGARELPPKVAETVRRQAEGQLGMRCNGCGERVGVGFRFTRIEVGVGDDGVPAVDVAHVAACNGDSGCDFAARARAAADVVEMVEFVWLDEGRESSNAEDEPTPVKPSVVDERRARAAGG